MSGLRLRPDGSATLHIGDFPVPPWATRALCEHVIGEDDLFLSSALNAGAGRGYMARALAEYFHTVTTMDCRDYGAPLDHVGDFLTTEYQPESYDWMISAPPFKLADKFVLHSLPIASVGVAVLVRPTFIESRGRYDRLFRPTPPWRIAPFAERVPMVEGRLDPDVSTATGSAWYVWRRDHVGRSTVKIIPPCRKELEKPGDYS